MRGRSTHAHCKNMSATTSIALLTCSAAAAVLAHPSPPRAELSSQRASWRLPRMAEVRRARDPDLHGALNQHLLCVRV